MSANCWIFALADGDETTLEFLDRRERVLSSRLEMALAAVDQLRVELEQIQRAKAALAPATYALSQIPFKGDAGGPIENVMGSLYGLSTPTGQSSAVDALMGAFSEDQSIKGLIRSAFAHSQHFRMHGAGLGQLRQYIKDTFDKDIERTSLSPALSRLRDDGILTSGPDNRWRLSKTSEEKPSLERMILEVFRENPDQKIPEEFLQTNINNKFSVVIAVETITATLIQMLKKGVLESSRGWVRLTRRGIEELGPAS